MNTTTTTTKNYSIKQEIALNFAHENEVKRIETTKQLDGRCRRRDHLEKTENVKSIRLKCWLFTLILWQICLVIGKRLFQRDNFNLILLEFIHRIEFQAATKKRKTELNEDFQKCGLQLQQ